MAKATGAVADGLILVDELPAVTRPGVWTERLLSIYEQAPNAWVDVSATYGIKAGSAAGIRKTAEAAGYAVETSVRGGALFMRVLV